MGSEMCIRDRYNLLFFVVATIMFRLKKSSIRGNACLENEDGQEMSSPLLKRSYQEGTRKKSNMKGNVLTFTSIPFPTKIVHGYIRLQFSLSKLATGR